MPGLLRGLARTADGRGHRDRRLQPGLPPPGRPVGGPDDQQQAYAPQQAPRRRRQAPPEAGDDPVIAQLKDLADLKAQGVLSEEEFEVQKRAASWAADGSRPR